MKKRYVLLFLISLLACKEKRGSISSLPGFSSYTVFADGDSLCRLEDFLSVRDYTVTGFVDTDCSVCLAKVSVWLSLSKRYSTVTSVLITSSQESRKIFWDYMLTYFQGPLYVIFDVEGHWQGISPYKKTSDTRVLDAEGKILFEGNITEKKFRNHLETFFSGSRK